jgi:flagellar motor switch protein FliN
MAAPSVQPKLEGASDPWAMVENLPCILSVEIPVPSFTVGDLMRLGKGRVIATNWVVGHDLPLRINGAMIAWIEFEVVQERLAVRLTELG